MNRNQLSTLTSSVLRFYDQTNIKYHGKSKLLMRFYHRTGFLGDIGTIAIDLTSYGDLSGEKSIGIFASAYDSALSYNPEFSNMKIWNQYHP